MLPESITDRIRNLFDAEWPTDATDLLGLTVDVQLLARETDAGVGISALVFFMADSPIVGEHIWLAPIALSGDRALNPDTIRAAITAALTDVGLARREILAGRPNIRAGVVTASQNTHSGSDALRDAIAAVSMATELIASRARITELEAHAEMNQPPNTG